MYKNFLFFYFFLLFFTFFEVQAQDSLFIVQKITIKGNDKTKKWVILKEMNISEGDTIPASRLHEKLEINQKQIYRINLFTYVTVSHEVIEKNTITVVVNLKESWTIIPNFNFEVADRNFNDWWYNHRFDFSRVIWGIDLLETNFRGRLEVLKLTFDTGFSRNYNILYQRPYLIRRSNSNIGITLGLGYNEYNSVAYTSEKDKLIFKGQSNTIRNNFSATFGLLFRKNIYWFQNIGIGYTQSNISQSLSEFSPNYFGNSITQYRILGVSYSLTYDKTDNVNYPLYGKNWQTSLILRQSIGREKLDQWLFSASYAHFGVLGKRWFYNHFAKIQVNIPTYQPYFLVRGLGYSDNIRGFELYVVDGTSYLLQKNNLKYKIFQKLFSFPRLPKHFNVIPLALFGTLFVDHGYVHYDQAPSFQSQLANRYLIGYGGGIDIVTYWNYVFKFKYSINSIGEKNLFFTWKKDF